ncbi:hypothetical protein CHL76_01610 [Marinococcus halophilus]|uniref:PTS sorbitol transporter subunit IIA n=1 Tax=Marinococcus halophilus TaxID=1371 RepID=A0A510YAD0_MARHA|nr:PTS glucitol/sorbitol transporter subunit IIA [Marinococcus halophilus]OZT81816.1 hypothetical protein CHL76_01610 [Marinococcus halophilus]GEK60334.1 PTS sorbitol transporter subunit IIA [Marinococcus halophilus]
MQMNTEIFTATVVGIGEDAQMLMDDGMMILFNETAPKDLYDISFVHNAEGLNEDLAAGDELVIDGEAFSLTFVGAKANETLRDLGHATFQFNGETSSDLPGTVCVEAKPLPAIQVGSTITFRKQ